jgi:hypothetical protein
VAYAHGLTFFEFFDYRFAKTNKSHKLPSPSASLGRCALSNNSVVSIQLWKRIIGVAVAFDVSVDRGYMPADLHRDLSHRDLRRP